MPSGITRKYAPDDVAVNVGTQIISGFMEGTFIEAERTAETGQVSVGADGEATLVISPNQSGTIKFTLQQASPSNDFLTSLFLALQAKNTAVAVVPTTINDKNGSTIVHANQSWTQKPAKVSFADKGEGREWTLVSGYLDMNVGGESSV